jgi:hypothetical protein
MAPPGTEQRLAVVDLMQLHAIQSAVKRPQRSVTRALPSVPYLQFTYKPAIFYCLLVRKSKSETLVYLPHNKTEKPDVPTPGRRRAKGPLVR